MKKIAIIAAIFACLGLFIWGVNAYLAPDDIAGCVAPNDNDVKCKSADAIVAVSGGDTTARTNEAIRLYKDGWAPMLIFSGAAQDKSGPSNAEVMRDIALSSGVPRNAIITEELGATTRENAVNTKAILDDNNVKSVLLVTSAYHERRASLEFEKRAPEVEVRRHPVIVDNQWSSAWWLTPNGWYLAISELVKVFLFHLGVSG